jgi:RHS repeat-associated protein
VGRISEVLQNRATNGYAAPTQFYYDNLGRLSSIRQLSQTACGTAPDTTGGHGFDCIPNSWGPGTVLYAYDSVGNRKDRLGQYLAGNRVSFFSEPTEGSDGWQFAHDDDGNLRRKYWVGSGRVADRRYTYSGDGLLTKVWSLEGTVQDSVEFDYSATGQLARRKRGGRVDRYYLWDGLNLLAELDSTGTVKIAEFVHEGIDRPLALITKSAGGDTVVRYFAQDELGNVMGVFSSVSGQWPSIAQSITYSDWGKPTISGALADTNRLAWKGLIWQEAPAELYYMRNRWYDPDLGRFLTEDPIGLAGGINKYVFAGDDPINGHDPLGLLDCKTDPTPPECRPMQPMPPEIIWHFRSVLERMGAISFEDYVAFGASNSQFAGYSGYGMHSANRRAKQVGGSSSNSVPGPEKNNVVTQEIVSLQIGIYNPSLTAGAEGLKLNHQLTIGLVPPYLGIGIGGATYFHRGRAPSDFSFNLDKIRGVSAHANGGLGYHYGYGISPVVSVSMPVPSLPSASYMCAKAGLGC